MRKVLIGALVVLVSVVSAQAAITMTATPVANPLLLPGLSAFKVTMSTGTAETIYNIKNLVITGLHQAWMGTSMTPWEESWAGMPPAQQPAQLANDSYLLMEPDTPMGNDTLPNIGAPLETNDGSNPTGGVVFWEADPTYAPNVPCVLGCGVIDWTGGACGLDLNYKSETLELAHIVVHANCTGVPHVYAEVKYGDLQTPSAFIDEDIPEPATMSLLALGACLPLLRRRRR